MKIENVLVPIDFVVLEMKFNDKYALLLGRSFLASSRAIIDVRGRELKFNLKTPHNPIPN